MARDGSRLGTVVLLALWGAACSDEATATRAENEPNEQEASGPDAFADGSAVVALGSAADAGWQLRDERTGAALRATLAGARNIPRRANDARAAYPDALGAGFDHEIEKAPGGARDRLRLPSAPADGEVRYSLDLAPPIAGLRAVGGGVELLLADGTPALRVNGASVEDARGTVTPLVLEVEGCAFDEDVRPPWRRPITPPGAERCDLVARLPGGLAYPALFDPLWTVAAVMPEPRFDFETVTLDDGTVLVVGGRRPGDHGRRVLAFDPDTLTWSTLGATANLTRTCDYFALTKLQDGRLLFAGGFCDTMSGTQELAEAFVFTPSTPSWTSVSSMANPRGAPVSALLPDGTVLVAGGQDSNGALATCEIFDPVAGTWGPAPSMNEAREYHKAVDIGGRVLVAGGIPEGATSTETAEIYDPAGGGSWTPTLDFSQPRYLHTLTKLGDDKVLMAGGLASWMFVASAIEVFDIPSETWSLHPTTYLIQDARAARGPGGGVLLTGGCAAGEDSVDCGNPSNAAFWFDPVTTESFTAENISTTRGRHGMATLQDERVVVMGGKGGNSSGSIAVTDTRVYDDLMNGGGCRLAFECASGFCVDGVCCDTACDGLCSSCLAVDTGGTDGTCAPISSGTDPASECVDDGSPSCGQNGLCEGGACDTYDGPGCTPTACVDGTDCTSGFCVDGVCCDTACEGICQACSAEKKGTGPDGTCGPVAKLTDPDGDCGPGNLACEESNVCDGASACASVLSLCLPFICTGQGCLTVCTADFECQNGAVCAGGACVAAESLCTNLTQAVGRDGTVTDCSPYRCNTDGTCRLACASIDDCALGLVCDPDTSECAEPPPAEGGEEGCACKAVGRASPRDAQAPFGAFALLFAFLVRRRRAA